MEIEPQKLDLHKSNINDPKLVLKLIEEIKSRPEIWNNSSKNAKIRVQLWNEVANILQLDVEVVKWKWKNLRNVHRETLKKAIISESSEEKQAVTWQFFDAMNFLNHHVNLDHNHSLPMVDLSADSFKSSDISRLIEEVKKRPILWNTKMVSSPFTPLKIPMWEEVAEVLQINLEQCKKKWRSLCDIYRQTLKRYAVHKTLGVKDKPFKTWKYFSELSFLNSHVNSPAVKCLPSAMEIANTPKKEVKARALSGNLKILRLIGEVKEQPILWNDELVDFQNVKLKNRAWRSIAKKLGVDCKIVIMKWKNIYKKYIENNSKLPKSYNNALIFLNEIKYPKTQKKSRANGSVKKTVKSNIEETEVSLNNYEERLDNNDDNNDDPLNLSNSPIPDEDSKLINLLERTQNELLEEEEATISYLEFLQDEDVAFFVSLLPMVAKIDSHKKAAFRSKIRKLIMNAKR